MSNICQFTAPASRDIETIIDLIADNSGFDAAERFLKKVNQKCKNLASFPNMGRRRDELLQELRSFPVDDYRLFRSCYAFVQLRTFLFLFSSPPLPLSPSPPLLK